MNRRKNITTPWRVGPIGEKIGMKPPLGPKKYRLARHQLAHQFIAGSLRIYVAIWQTPPSLALVVFRQKPNNENSYFNI